MSNSKAHVTRMSLRCFKCFRSFDVTLPAETAILGPNNAGKSSLVSCLRSAATMLRHAKNRRPNKRVMDGTTLAWVYFLDQMRLDLEEDNLHFDLMEEEARFAVTFATGWRLVAVWPPRDAAFFYLAHASLPPIQDPSVARRLLPNLVTIPPLHPLEPFEPLLAADTVLKSRYGRLSSRHFRNRLLLMRGVGPDSSAFEGFRRFVATWLPEIALEPPSLVTRQDGSMVVPLFYTGGRMTREISWVGDGTQIFLQILLHIYTNDDADTLVLDEPDIYLHPDLQRRLLRLLTECDLQTIVTTHSSEIALEVPHTASVWVDRSQSKAVRAPSESELEDLTEYLGTQFSLRIARLLRTKLALFVEGDDIDILRAFARPRSGDPLRTEHGLTVVPLEGEANRVRTLGFAWLAEKFLQRSVRGIVLLDRDWKTDEDVLALEREFGNAGITLHVWERHELESYVLYSPALARYLDLDVDLVEQMLDSESGADRDSILRSMFEYRRQQTSQRGRDPGGLLKACQADLQAWWSEPEERVAKVPAKELIRRLNEALEPLGTRHLSAVNVAKSMSTPEIPGELRAVFRSIDHVAEG
jgi:hypothetical protein